MEPVNLIFMGTAPIAVPSLEELARFPAVKVAGVVTQPDRPSGRDLKLRPSAVKIAAERLGLPLLQPEKLREPSAIEGLKQFQPGLVVVVAFGQILPVAVLELPRFGCLNIHTSLLPKYRGAAPIQWALWNDDRETGVTLMKMDAGLDTGPILARTVTPISESDDAISLHDRLALLGADLLRERLPAYLEGRLLSTPQQNSEATLARKISKEDGELDWAKPARELWNQVRALVPWPGTFTRFRDRSGAQRLLKIWKVGLGSGQGKPGTILELSSAGILVATGREALRLLEVQTEGGKRMPADAFISGAGLKAGDLLG